jgi:hypothetical protein
MEIEYSEYNKIKIEVEDFVNQITNDESLKKSALQTMQSTCKIRIKEPAAKINNLSETKAIRANN